MRVYIPATFAMLQQLESSGVFSARSGYGFAVTPALREFYREGEEEDFAEFAFDDAARASIRLLAIGDVEQFPHRRVVVSIDVEDAQVSLEPDLGETVVSIKPAQIAFEQVAAIHIDVESSEAATAAAIEVIDAADLGEEGAELTVGDALDNYLAWYDPSELGILVQLL
ncbi:hypothetical protein P4N68_08225 [Corynebacterium felinum]|uniref:Uncharacterized protein n=1 Tax=Corynebacterium felinum TaxID=131318 RepID=A0ABU2BB12_9CORY|nr:MULTISPECIES: hypothetical protein [Corynebacterium]MDF5821064.1 hypothetical protein [Corynebacterium felinum]MDO4761242.1 hypothetical protein [Corynebacterium sp.]MDR7354928.1 hypothetical protein [Corynebacterium felinum]WJY94288.1 hypothetical protein CFELI_03230 [Corynebacterium felinum]